MSSYPIALRGYGIKSSALVPYANIRKIITALKNAGALHLIPLAERANEMSVDEILDELSPGDRHAIIYGLFDGEDEELREFFLRGTSLRYFGSETNGCYFTYPPVYLWDVPETYPKTKDEADNILFGVVSKLCDIQRHDFDRMIQEFDMCWDDET